jgi:hypothetical protein
MMQEKDDGINKPPPFPLHLISPELASLLSDLPISHARLTDFERWVEKVEREPKSSRRILETQAYVVCHEELDPVSSRFYRLVGGTPPPGVHYYIGEVPIFIALAAASGVVGNLAYDALKKIVCSFLDSESRVIFEEKVTFEEYETIRKEFHEEDAQTGTGLISIVEREVGLKRRLLIERKWTKE